MVHYEVWNWPEGGAPHITEHPEWQVDPGPPCHAVGWPEDPTGDHLVTVDPDEAKDCVFAWLEADHQGQYRVVKITTEVLEVCGCAAE